AELQTLVTLHGPPSLSGKGFAMLETGLSTTLDAAAAGFHLALRDDNPEVLHDWRKRVKDHLYHCRLLSPLWPEMLQPRAVLLNRLAEALGDRNDLTTLSAALPPLPDPMRERVQGAIAAQHASLAQIALPLGARLFSEPPGARARHWRALWHIWQAEA
ncbi:CHAD domain-containing protein, partial [Thioclava sp. BHET1]